MAKKRASKSQTPLLWHNDLPEVEAKVNAKVEVKVKVKTESNVPPPTPPLADATRRDATQEGEKGGNAELTTEVESQLDTRPDTRPSLVLDSKSKRPPKREKCKPEVETFDRNSLPDVIIESRFLVSDEEWEVGALEIMGMPTGMYRELWGLEGEWIGWVDSEQIRSE